MATTRAPQDSVPELVQALGDDVRQLVRAEIGLAKAELKDTMKRGIMVGAGAAAAALGGLLFFIFSLVTLTEWRGNHTLVAGIIAMVGIALVVAGGGLIWANRRLWPIGPIQRSLKEDVQWLRQQSKRVKR